MAGSAWEGVRGTVELGCLFLLPAARPGVIAAGFNAAAGIVLEKAQMAILCPLGGVGGG